MTKLLVTNKVQLFKTYMQFVNYSFRFNVKSAVVFDSLTERC